jgi:hypothetical protein
MKFKNIELMSDTEKMEYVNELLHRANDLLDEAFKAHLKEVGKRAAQSGRMIRETFGNERS